jgi:serine/threonine-protein kinase
MVFGTPEFMSPEQAQGEPLDNRSDIYSLALILYELITGKLPFDAKTPLDMMKAHVRDAPIPLSERVAGKTFWPELDAVIAKALAKSPDDRYASAAEFGEALLSCLPGTPAKPASVPPQANATASDAPAAVEAEPAPAPLPDLDPSARRESTVVPDVPRSRLPTLVVGLMIGLGVATAGYFALAWFGH